MNFLFTCEFCERPLCELCVHDNSFGHCCKQCNSEVETGIINEYGVNRRREPMIQWDQAHCSCENTSFNQHSSDTIPFPQEECGGK